MMTEAWIAVAGTAVIGWAAWITRRSFGALTREEHEAICQVNNIEINKRLDKIFNILETSEQRATEHRDNISVQVGVMESKVAVLKDRSDRAESETNLQRRKRIRRNNP